MPLAFVWVIGIAYSLKAFVDRALAVVRETVDRMAQDPQWQSWILDTRELFGVETLAKLYLESKPARISDEAIADLCDWLMSEFQQLPLNLQFSDYQRYSNAEEMFADIEQNQLWVSADTYDTSIFPNPIYGFFFQAVHDYDHYLTKSDFSLEGEIAAYNATAKRAPSLEIQKILYSEIVLRSAAYLHLGHAPTPMVVFP